MSADREDREDRACDEEADALARAAVEFGFETHGERRTAPRGFLSGTARSPQLVRENGRIAGGAPGLTPYAPAELARAAIEDFLAAPPGTDPRRSSRGTIAAHRRKKRAASLA